MTALIHCAGMPLVSVGAVAVLCDVVEFDLPDTSTYAARSARDEAARLMAHLPASCRVLPHAPSDSDHLAGADPEKAVISMRPEHGTLARPVLDAQSRKALNEQVLQAIQGRETVSDEALRRRSC